MKSTLTMAVAAALAVLPERGAGARATPSFYIRIRGGLLEGSPLDSIYAARTAPPHPAPR